MVTAIQHRPETKRMTLSEKELEQLKPPVLSIDRPAEEAKCDDLVKITIGDDPEKFFQIGSQLPQQERKELIEFLKQNIDVFA